MFSLDVQKEIDLIALNVEMQMHFECFYILSAPMGSREDVILVFFPHCHILLHVTISSFASLLKLFYIIAYLLPAPLFVFNPFKQLSQHKYANAERALFEIQN